MKIKHLSKNGVKMCALYGAMLFFLACGAGMSPEKANASDVSVSPKIIDIAIQPRDIIEEKIVVKNNSNTKTSLFTFVNNVTVGLEGGVQEFITPSMSDRSQSLSSWLEIRRAGFDIDPQQTIEIPLTIHVDSSAKPGVYHALISFSTGSNEDQAMVAVKDGSAPSVLLTTTYTKEIHDELKLKNFAIKKFITQDASDAIQYRIENPGSTEVKPGGDIVVYDQRGGEVATIPVNPEGKTIQAGTSELFQSGFSHQKLFGKYKAFLTIRYGDKGATINDTVYFYFFPWQKIAIAFSLFVGLALMVTLWLHYRYLQPVEDDEEGIFLPVQVRRSRSESHAQDVVIKKR